MKKLLADAQVTIHVLQEELAETNRGLVALHLELEQRVEERTAELAQSNEALCAEIAERKRTEEALRESEERFRTAFEDAAVPMTLTAMDGRLLEVNSTFCQMLGYAQAELAGQDFADFTHPDDLVENLVGMQRLVSGKAFSFRMEKRYIRKDGSIIWGDMSTASVRDAHGKPLYLVTHVSDITERKRAQEALTAAKISAEQAKARAEDAADLAEQANQAKDHFLAVLSHELRTPLTPVLATVSMLQQDPHLDGDTREELEVIRRNAELEARLIDDLLDVSRILHNKVELNKQPIELCTIIKHAVEVCRPDIEVRKLEFGVDIGHDAPYILEADPARLQQVIWNLLKNAIKFTPEGGCVGIRCWRDRDGFVVAEVNDSGVGIEPEALGTIFNAFEQAERSITRQFGGLGLGLTISKAMVEMHGGTIEAHSPGKHQGATFRVRLPLLTERPHLLALKDKARATAAPRPAGPLRILLVEDHGDTARIMKRMLTRDGHEVETAADLATALKMAVERTFDLMVSDLGLPDGSGLDLMRTLRARGSTLVGIALSGFGEQKDIQQSRDAGFAAHLTKPADYGRLVEVIRQLTG